MPAMIKLQVMHVSRENSTFVPIKPKVVIHVFTPIEGENKICAIRIVFALFNTIVHFDT